MNAQQMEPVVKDSPNKAGQESQKENCLVMLQISGFSGKLLQPVLPLIPA